MSTPLVPFGYGLSYSSFTYSNLWLDRQVITAGKTWQASVDVTNGGDR